MQTLMRRLFWWTILALFVAVVVFLCFCFIPLENYVESDRECMKLSHDVHHVDTDFKTCPGCHPFLWRFNYRCMDIEEEWNDAKETQQKEEERLKRVEEKEKAGK